MDNKYNFFEATKFDIIDIINRVYKDKNYDKLETIIYNNHSIIFNYDLFSGNYLEDMKILFTDSKFLDCILRIIGKCDLTKNEIICINKIVYDYMTYSNFDLQPDNLENIVQFSIIYKLFNISCIINRTLINDLISFKLTSNEAKLLALVGNSDFHERNIINRVDDILIKILYRNRYDINDNLISIIINIYSRLFGNLVMTKQNLYTLSLNINYDIDTIKLTNIFISCMFEYLDNNNDLLVKKYFDCITEAILIMIENKYEEIRKDVLYNYGWSLKEINHINPDIISNNKFRTHLKEKVNYPNILNTIDTIEREYGNNVLFI